MNDDEIKKILESELDKAEKTWKTVKPLITEEYSNFLGSSVPSKIPGHPLLVDGKPQVDDFIAFILDIRGSTKHLLQAISEKTAKASQLERVLYETTAINTIGILLIEKYNGGVTEFLGDGFLALFKVDQHKHGVYNAHNAAKECIRIINTIVNKTLAERYSLPPLVIGIGMAYSKAIVTTIGLKNNLHPKALGECVYRASKISKGLNEIMIDEKLKILWPSTKDGCLQFNIIKHPHDFNAYKISSK
jgi:hypothetical protein